jgi:GAF domain-containing protein
VDALAAPSYDLSVVARTGETRVLHEIVSTVASSLELDDVLRAVVRLLSEGSAVHACFVYLVDESGDRLVLRAADPPYDQLIGQIVLRRGEGLAWWAADRGEPAFIRDNLLDDPRTKYVPEFEEERFQSLLCVPIRARDESVIGVISAHTVAPREFSDGEVDFLVSSASLVAGAIENARLYHEMRTRVDELEQLTELAGVIAASQTVDELVREVSQRAVELLAARAVHLHLLEPGSEELEWRASSPAGEPRRAIGLAELGPELARGGRSSRLCVPLVAGDELVGLLVAEGSYALDLARAVASQAAVGIRKIQLIDRLTEKNLIKDFFEELAGGRATGDLEGRAARLGCLLDAAHLVLAARPVDDELERALASAVPGSLFDRREDSLRALLRVPSGDAAGVVARVRAVHEGLGRPVAVGLSSVCADVRSLAAGFEEAEQAVLGTTVLGREPGVLAFDELGAYKYLLRIALEGGVRDATVEAVAKLAAYDSARGSSLLVTLEEFLKRRGSVSATAEALFVHQNTLRQRLRRIADLSGLDLRREDWLLVEIAVKMVRLRSTLGAAASHTAAG